MIENSEAIWLKARDILKKELNNEQIFNTWISPIQFISLTNDRIIFEIQNKFFRDWIFDHYIDIIRSAIKMVCDKELKIDFLFRESEKNSKAFSRPIIQIKDPIKEAGLDLKYTFENFVVGPSNRSVYAAALAVSDSPAKIYNPLFIYGGVGLGKTHLMRAITHHMLQKNSKIKVLYITSENFTNELIGAIRNRTTDLFRKKYRHVDILLIDDIQFIAGKDATQEEFFNTFNALYDEHKQIVISSDRLPKETRLLEERLVSRFLYGLVTDVKPPDFDTRVAILKKKSEQEKIALPKDVLYFLGEKITANIRELEGALIRVVACSKFAGKDVSIDIAKEVLKDMIIEKEKIIRVEIIQAKVSEYFGIKLSDMKIKSKNAAVAYPRQIAMYLSRQLTDVSLSGIGEHFGGRNHATVMHACGKIERDLKEKSKTSTIIANLIQGIKG